MSKLSDDEVSSILNFIHEKCDRNSFAMVCKQWLRVEGLSRLSIQVHDPEFLQNFLPRFRNVLSFTSSGLLNDDHLKLVGRTCQKLETLNLTFRQTKENFDEIGNESGFGDFGDNGIRDISNGCRNLTKISLKRRKYIGSLGIESIAGNLAENLTYLDVGRCTLIDDSALKAIGKLSSILTLNLDGCSLITDKGLAFLAEGSCSKSLRKLIIAECDRITDSGVTHLKEIICLEVLSLAECGPKVTNIGGRAIASIKTLKRLDFSWLINIKNITIHAIAEQCKELVEINLTGCGNITGTGLSGFGSHEHLESIVLTSCHNISGNDLEVLFQCQSLTYIVLDRGLKMWLPAALRDYINIDGRVHWG